MFFSACRCGCVHCPFFLVKKNQGAFTIGHQGQDKTILQSCAFLCRCRMLHNSVRICVTRVRSLTTCLRVRSVTLPASWKFVDELTKIVAPGLEEMRDGGQDYEVMFGKMPRATGTRVHGLVECAAFARSLLLFFRATFGSIATSINTLRCCWCRGSFVLRRRRSKLAGHARMKRTVISGDAAQNYVQVETQS